MTRDVLSYRPPRDETEARTFADVAMTALSPSPPNESDGYDRWRSRWEGLGEMRLVFRGDRLAGGMVGLPMGQWFGGRSVPVSAVTAVAVAPEHRSHGVATFLVREQLHELHASHVPLAALYPATQPVYRHGGYERAGSRIGWRLALREIEPVRDELAVRPLVESDVPRVREIYTERARRCSGYFDRSEAFWKLRVLSVPRARTMAQVFETEDGRLEAYVIYSHREQAGTMHYDLVLRDFGASSPRGVRAIVAFLTSHRSIAEHAMLWSAGVDPLVMALDEQDVRAVTQRFDWMLRLVDLPAALMARGYAEGLDAALQLEVRDDAIPANAGRFVLRVRDGIGRVERGGEGRMQIDVRGLASLYTGYATPHELLLAGRASFDEASARAAQAIFAGPVPGMTDMF